MDGKQYPMRLDAFGSNAERLRPQVDRRKENPFLFRDSSVDPVNTGAVDKVNRFLSPRYFTMEQQVDQMTPPDSEIQFLEQSERMEKKLQQSIMLLNHKQQMQHNILLMQQQQIQQQRQVQLQQNEQLQQSQVMTQLRPLRQRSPDKQRQDPNVENQTGYQKLENNRMGEMHNTQCQEPLDNMSVQDLFMQCQNHLDVINACTDLQQTIKDEMKKQAKLDNIICQKLVSKAQRLQQQATFLEKAHAPSWVGPALLELGSQVTQQAEVHHIYTATLIEQCVVIQHSLDGHHELMKSVLAEHTEPKQKPLSFADIRNKSITSVADKRSQMKVGDEGRSMTFLQASNIFEGIRKPRMKLLSSLEYQQEQLNATIMHLGQVDSEIESLLNKDDSESLMWRAQLQKKDLEIRKEFLQTRKDQLDSDVQFAKMDLTDFEFSNKDSLLEILNVFRQHRIRYDTTLRQSFQLLKAASLRDISYLRRQTKKSDLDANMEPESGDIYESLTCKQSDPWGCASKTASKITTNATAVDKAHDSASTHVSVMFSKSTSPQVSRKKSPYLQRNNQEQIDAKMSAIEQTYPIVLSSDSEMSDVQKSSMYSPELKPVKTPTVSTFNVGQFQNMADFNFSRAESSPSLTETSGALVMLAEVSELSALPKPPDWRTVNEKLQSFQKNTLQCPDDDRKLIISRYVDEVNVCDNQAAESSIKSGTEDIMIVTRGPKPRLTLGSFENNVDTECSVHCLYPMTTLREISCSKDEKRVAHLINKYASGSRRPCLGKNWNSCKPMLWCGIGKTLLKENVSRRKMNRSLKYCKLLTQHNILTEFNETKHVNSLEPLLEHLKGQNVNNSEILQGQGDHENVISSKQSSEQDISSKSLPAFSCSQVDDSKHHLNSGGCHSEQHRQDASTCTCESETEQYRDESVTFSESMISSHVNEDINCDAADGQSLIMNSCEQLPGQGSRNLNNCEPLKSHVVDAGVVVNREDQMDFEVIQVLCPDTQPRHVRVCAVRPIPSDVDRGGAGQTVAKGLTTNSCEDPQARAEVSCKYDNLKVYEITAGQFTVSELQLDTTSSSKIDGNKVDCASNKYPDFTDISSHILPNPDCLQKSNFSSFKNHVYESKPRDTVKLQTVRKSTLVNCGVLTAADAAVGYSTNVHSETFTCHTAFCKEQFTNDEDTRTVSISDGVKISGTLSVPQLHSQGTKRTHDLSSGEYIKPDRLNAQSNNFLNKENVNDKFDEDETLSKTFYVPGEHEHVLNLCGSNGDKYKLKEVTDSVSISVQKKLQEFGGAKINNGEVTTNTTRPLTRNLSNQMTKDTTNQAARNMSSQRMSAPEDGQGIDKRNFKGVEFLVEDEFLCKDETQVEDKYEKNKTKNSDNAKSQSLCKNMAEMVSFTPKQSVNQMNQKKESGGDECDHNQDYFRKLTNGQSLEQTKGYTNNHQQQTQTRPLKSSLKKSSVPCSSDPDSTSEAKEVCKYVPQCGMPSLAGSGELPLQRDSDRIHKCVKQVRFDHRVHYDDNTVTDTLDITISQETKPVAPCPPNTSKNCTGCTNKMSVQQGEIVMYSTIMTSSYCTNNCNFSATDDLNNRFSVT